MICYHCFINNKKIQIIKEVTILKRKFFTIIISALILSATALSGCGCQDRIATPDEAVSISASVENMANDNITETVPTLSDTDKAIIDEGLKVDDKGNITDSKGNKVEVKDDGTVEVKTKSGETVKVKVDDVKTANVNNQKVEEVTRRVNNNSDSSSSANNKSASNNNNQSSKKPNNGSSVTPKPTSKSNGGQSSAADPHAGKTYHEAVYKTVNHPAETKVVNHPAETKEVKVVDKEAYTYEEPVYEYQYRAICKNCGADITDNTTAHNKQHALNGEVGGWYTDRIKIQTGTKTVTVPEQSHYETVVVKEAWSETVVVKEAWTEKVLVKEAGWY